MISPNARPRPISARTSVDSVVNIVVRTIVYALIVGLVGLYGGIFVVCTLTEGNLCGLVGVFITGPLGCIVGAIWGIISGRGGNAKSKLEVPGDP
jgi:hypothetical protein